MVSGRLSTSGARFPSLDGLRAVAVLLVMVAHYFARTHQGHGFGDRLLSSEGDLGVGLFFAISGFLITSLLLLEQRQVGRIHLWRFYARRAARLWPALWLLVGATVALGALGLLRVQTGDVLGALFFTTDYTADIAGKHEEILFHTWSLSVEEQFYILWPALLLITGLVTGRRLLVAAVVAAPLVRVASYVLMPGWREAAPFQFHTRFDILAAGCLLAVYWHDDRLQDALRRYRVQIAAVCLVALCLVQMAHVALTSAAFTLVAGYSLESFALAGLVGVAMTSADTAAGRILNGRALVHLGLISYSLYLWQEMFIRTPFGVFHVLPLGILAAVACAELSWRSVERPLAPLRQRLHPSR